MNSLNAVKSQGEGSYSECIKGPLKKELCKGLDQLGLRPSANQVSQLCKYLEQLGRWNKVYNLTAVRDIDDMLVQHMFDCLAIIKPLQEYFLTPIRVLDVGSGAGLPAVVIAVLNPEWQVTAVDAVHKKMAFVQQQALALGVNNLKAVHGRIEDFNDPVYELIVSRACSSLNDFVILSQGALAPHGVWCAMKGKMPTDEMDALKKRAEVFHVKQLTVPEMNAERCLVWMRRAQSWIVSPE
ncbi:MAG: 16S rRNA (guanine(527)-N(7))-methyltransferase RsmG [Saezia sp.]